MSLKRELVSNSRRHPYGPSFDVLGRMQPYVDLTNGERATIAQLRGTSLDKVVDSSFEVGTNDILNEFGFPNKYRRDLLTSYNGDHRYGAQLVREAGRLTNEMGFKADYDLTSLNWQHAFISLMRFIQRNDVNTARLLLERTGLSKIDDAAKRIKGYTTIQADNEYFLVPKTATRFVDAPSNAAQFDKQMQLAGFIRELYHDVPIYIRNQNKINSIH